MATQRFQKASPYTYPAAPPPKEDTKYQSYEEDLRATPGAPKKRFGVALFGVGRAGTIHLSNLTREPQVDILYIVEDDKLKWSQLKNYWNLQSTKFCTSSQSASVFSDPRVDAVVVASPTHTHEILVVQALENRKAVFCEKPLAETSAKTEDLFKKAHTLQVPLLSAFNRRFDPAYQSVRERVRAGEIGKVLTIKVCSRDSPLPTLAYLKSSGGIFHDCAVHDIDQIVSILGEYPTRVWVSAKANIPEIAAIQDFDTVAITLEYVSGTLGMIDLSRHSTFGYDQRLEVFGQEGMIKAENQKPIENVELFTGQGVKTAPIAYSFASRYAEAYQRELRHFIDVLEGKSQIGVSRRDVWAITKIASACEESAQTGKPVDLFWSEEELL